ncbi:MAG: hypothetical protein Q9225_004931 [Loekoesia sp. 1 TL-2023]
MTRSPSSPSDGASDHYVRAEPRLLKAIEEGKNADVGNIVEGARSQGQSVDHLLRIGLMRAVERNNIGAAEYLALGTSPDSLPNRVSPLMRAVEKNHVAIVSLLLSHGANIDSADKQGRTVLMTAAWKNHWHITHELIKRGANVNAKDNAKRNVLHNLAADKHLNWGKDIIDLLLKTNISVDGQDGQDSLKRSPLHWACVTGKSTLAEWLLTRPRSPRANVNATEIREKTPLHLAAAHGRDDIVELLLRYAANVQARSDGSWTALHNACEHGSAKIVRMLLQAGADVNARLLNGMTPLHVAAQAGHMEVVQCLLTRMEIKRAARDSFGITPFLRAAQSKRKDIVNLLAPFNHVETLCEDALGACNGFNATIVDFGHFHNGNRVQKQTVYELLYGRDPINPRRSAVSILPKNSKATNFRWVHIPQNNLAWVEACLTKIFVEEGASDVEGFKKALERSFSHQHKGKQIHSHFMRPMCQSTPRAPIVVDEPELFDGQTDGPPQIVINGKLNGTPTPSTKRQPDAAPKSPQTSSRGQGHGRDEWPKDSGRDNGKGKEKKRPQEKTEKQTPSKDSRQQRRTSQPLSESPRLRSPGSPGRKDPTQVAKGNIFVFMPYLHFETNRRRQEMQEAIARAQEMKSRHRRARLQKSRTYDEMLLRAHLGSSTNSLHVRRTLDQFFYHNIDTQSRDQDQVVYRYQCKGIDPEKSDVDPKIFMVDQLWMWILGKNLIVTSFPQRWQQPKNDPLNVLDGVIEDINSKTREPVRSVFDLAIIITARCSGVFDRHRMDEDYQFLDMFESSIGDATDRETVLFKEFNTASVQASAWLQHHRRPNRFSRQLEATSRDFEHTNRKDAREERTVREERFRYGDRVHAPPFVDKLLDIGSETDLLGETKDIRDELNMIEKVLEDQRNVLPDIEIAVCNIYKEEHRSQQEIKRRFRDQLKTIEMHIKDINRMDKQAERIYDSITDLLDLKQKHANALEARFARDQAAGTARQSQTIMVFTIVTIIFLPLSFIAAIFTINIEEFPRDDNSGQQSLPLAYVSKYMFGIGFAISIPLICIALSLDAVGNFFHEIARRWQERRARHEVKAQAAVSTPADWEFEKDASVTTSRFERVLSAGPSTRGRRSGEADWGGGLLLPVTSRGT